MTHREQAIVSDTTMQMASSVEQVLGRDEVDEQLASQLVEHARAQGRGLTGPDGLLSKLTKMVLETGLEAEMSEHVGYEPHAAVGVMAGILATGVGRRR